MLANGATLGYKTTSSGSTYTNIPGVKEIPDLGADPEKVDNTCLTDSIKHYEMGIGDPGDMEYVIKYTSAVYGDLIDLEGEIYWQETTADGTVTTFTGYPSVKRNGGGVNSAMDITLAIALSSDLTITPGTGL